MSTVLGVQERAPPGSQDTHFLSEAEMQVLSGGKGPGEFQEVAAAEDPRGQWRGSHSSSFPTKLSCFLR